MKEALELYFEIKKQRKHIKTPVDTMGCSITPYSATEDDKMLYILVSLLLSSRTRDEATYEAMKRLRGSLPENGVVGGDEYNGLTVENINNSSVEHIKRCIESVGFHNRKSENLKKIGKILKEKGMPRKYEDVTNLPGVGNKMGILYMNHACGEVVGISVDTHVHRICNRIGLVSTKEPLRTQVELEKIVPRSEWGVMNGVLVGFGQVICLPRKPKCSGCCVRNRCPSSHF